VLVDAIVQATEEDYTYNGVWTYNHDQLVSGGAAAYMPHPCLTTVTMHNIHWVGQTSAPLEIKAPVKLAK
jgi:hypothetical protein